ncbi:MAG: aspartate-semialdehyde dehydrogenase [Corallococcus sp.]|nr:aspartate-semialdehyde dehydrogenase [Corallococcus sp.]MCM1359650.1 aspartate-semialdehyde dehydrogenase [Corallococcus sp.]MCM1395359.1 aspartate-semialdehyde dehydrogenase [Corallococcus sp.]
MANIAIVGAGGLVGGKLTEILADKLSEHKLRLFGNASAGKKVCCFGKNLVIEHVDELHKTPLDYAMFMAGSEVAKEHIPALSESGVVCIDNSSAFRMQKGVPLVIPQINGHTVGCCKLLANPNCTTIQVAIALHAVADLKLRSVTVATYQAVSGAGREGLADLQEKRTYGKLKCFPHPIFDNVIAQIGDVLPDGTTVEERKMRNECRKILEMPDLAVNSFCVRVPVSLGHGAFVNVKTETKPDLEKVRMMLKREKDVLVFDNVEHGVLPLPSVLRHTHFVGVGRVSADDSGGFNMFVVADNLLRGAAYNAYQILKISMQNNGDLV